MSIQCNCEYCQVDGNPCPLAEAQAALAASQAERERLVAELTTCGERVLEEIENANEKQGRLTDAEAALEEAQGRIAERREEADNDWKRIKALEEDRALWKEELRKVTASRDHWRSIVERVREAVMMDLHSSTRLIRIRAILDGSGEGE